ncbi:MAG: glycoside hydrolase family 38 C-terminal domain-containing protein [bacterium]
MADKSPKVTAMVCSTTHWDREWGSTFQQYRFRLIKLVDKLLKILGTDPDYLCFSFDGQAVPIEDYLEIRSNEREHIAEFIREGRIQIGPWYVSLDEFLCSSESIVHNALIGHHIAEEYGGHAMKAGYVPDTLGHISQLPQILNGFGIKSAFLMRGLGGYPEEDDLEIWWEGLDGTRVLLCHQRFSYGNASNIGHTPDGSPPDLDEHTQEIKKMIEMMLPKVKTPFVLFNNGGDFVEPSPYLTKVINHAGKTLPYNVLHASFPEYAEAVLSCEPNLGVIKGELRGAKHECLISGTSSARMHLKQRNREVETLLEKYAEPVAALASLLGLKYDRQYIRAAWKELLKNHAHDSIYGEHIDPATPEMMQRFASAEQMGELIRDSSLKHIAMFINTLEPEQGKKEWFSGISLRQKELYQKVWETEGDKSKALVVFNPHGWPISEIAKFTVIMGLPSDEMARTVQVRDENGKPVQCQMVNQNFRELEEGYPSAPNQKTWSFDLLIDARNVPAFGYKTFFADWAPENKSANLLVATPTLLENPYLRVDVNTNGTINITDKRSGVVYPNALTMEDTEDCGDIDDWSYTSNSQTFTNHGVNAEISLIETGPVRAAIRIEYDYMLPESLEQGRRGRSKKKVACRLSHEVRLRSDGTDVEVETKFDNRAIEHRLRMRATVPITTPTHVAETTFGVIERQNTPTKHPDWDQIPQATTCQQMWFAVDNKQYGLAVASIGLPEYQVDDMPESTEVALTLLRSVGWLARDDTYMRPYRVDPRIHTPLAYCLGEYTFNYRLIPYIGSWEQAKVWKSAHLLNAPLKVIEADQHPGNLALNYSAFTLDNDALVLSAVKLAEREDKLIVRIYNTTNQTVTGTITTPLNVLSAEPVNLNERLIDEPNYSVKGKDITLTLTPFKIATIAFEIGG